MTKIFSSSFLVGLLGKPNSPNHLTKEEEESQTGVCVARTKIEE
eukprot:CAMPEP_0201516514 /NCGR_PEP_ID=MMETSP0161_2-20130828/7825_1 /ASSEMBLY_ACC=CAM_ASM_000251 /TAXON_ID=180227 /ORGANISM="Neoparamoeba aestuarina, Strain SoJaBio B1-5/56/2" /LENGTH=43 /DNA_ID= /DNA_START= /DNA_END= /DNA_ORIENTATION=